MREKKKYLVLVELLSLVQRLDADFEMLSGKPMINGDTCWTCDTVLRVAQGIEA